MVEDYRNGNKKMLRILLEAIMVRKISGKHADGADKEIYEEIKKEIKDRENYLNGKEFYYCPLRDRIIIEQAQEISQAKQLQIKEKWKAILQQIRSVEQVNQPAQQLV
ncbi:uncharacterized protein LOC113338422 [Papaver somniferum]|uniref:uncharacterized protein LOC113338422 n=1 Tax=Papaver somniferum TaxID=3469 RepID=UPI000E7029C3|nr:uncharacterized protein LOC113338422 [Papaver somniferum]